MQCPYRIMQSSALTYQRFVFTSDSFIFYTLLLLNNNNCGTICVVILLKHLHSLLFFKKMYKSIILLFCCLKTFLRARKCFIPRALLAQRQNTWSDRKAARCSWKTCRKQHDPCLAWTGWNGAWPLTTNKTFYSIFEWRLKINNQSHQKLMLCYELKHTRLGV